MNGRLYFEYQFDDKSPKVSMELSPESTIDEAIEAFEAFLRAAGYYLNGPLVIESKESSSER